MRWDFGKVYKEIRKSKGLTQAEVCGDEISRTTLAKIEAGKTIPNFDHMIFLLNQINMSLEEFYYICHYYQPSKRQDIFNKVYNHASSAGVEELIDFQKLCQDYLSIHHDVPVSRLLDLITVFIEVRQSGFINPSEILMQTVEKAWDYLQKQDVWYERDLKLLNAILFSFPLETLPETTDKILDSLNKYKDYYDIKTIKSGILGNLSSIYLHNRQFSECERLSEMLYELAMETKRFDHLGYSQVRLGICKRDQHLIVQGLHLLEITGENQLIITLKKEISLYYKT
ncbi:helix-turn-helix domain-containing protein [Streptococcus caprae]|uniref:Helix-turn-helix domain-containing protein n=1 Tax=Streptococcus caprae TaxID=1640501 RepID=A0ABV8CZJ0_9STRE